MYIFTENKETVYKAFRYQLNLTEEQANAVNKQIGSCRYVYNWALNEKSKLYVETKTNISCFELGKRLTQLKKEVEWLNEVQAQALQMSLRNLDNAYTSFFKKKGKFPKFKSKKDSVQSFQYPQNVKLKGNQVYLPKIGWCHYYKHRDIIGTIKTVTVSRVATGKYFVSILCDTHIPKPTKVEIKESTTVGLDLGIKTLIVTSDGEMFENQRHFLKLQKRLKVEQRSLQRKFTKEGKSKNYLKQKLVVAKIYEKITNQRKDYLHKISTQLIREYDTICIEDLNVSGMIKNSKLAKHIQDCAWYSFRSMLELKSEEYGKNFIVIPRFAPSSKRCNSCGHINQIKLSDREFNCQSCNTLLNRDYNAAQNIKDYGLGIKPFIVNAGH